MLDDLAKRLGFPPLPTEDEVWGALDNDTWRSKQYIRKLIDETRLSIGKASLEEKSTFAEILGLVHQKILKILRELEGDGLVEAAYCSQLSIEEMAASDDDRISSPVAIQQLRTKRSGRKQVVYRKGKGGNRIRREDLERRTQGLGEVVTT